MPCIISLSSMSTSAAFLRTVQCPLRSQHLPGLHMQDIVSNRCDVPTGRIATLLVETRSIQVYNQFLPGETCPLWRISVREVLLWERTLVILLERYWFAPGGEWSSGAKPHAHSPDQRFLLGGLGMKLQGEGHGRALEQLLLAWSPVWSVARECLLLHPPAPVASTGEEEQLLLDSCLLIRSVGRRFAHCSICSAPRDQEQSRGGCSQPIPQTWWGKKNGGYRLTPVLLPLPQRKFN